MGVGVPDTPLLGLVVMTVVLRTPGCGSGSAKHFPFRLDGHDSRNEDSTFGLLSCGELQARGVGVPEAPLSVS